MDLTVAVIGQLRAMAGWDDGDDAIENRVARVPVIGAAHHRVL